MSEVAEAQTTLRDQLEVAFDSHDSEVDSRPRDESGRFAPKQADADTQTSVEAPQTAQVQAPEQTPAPITKPRPSSWKKDYEAHWSKLDPTLQDYISQRESDYAKGVSTYKQNWDQAAPIYEAMQPFMPLLQEHKINPKDWISNLGNAHRILALGTPEEKVQMFSKLATDYGINLQSLGQQQYDPQFSQLSQELNRLKNDWTQYRSAQEKQEMQSLENLVTQFSSDPKHPHFEQLSDVIMGLLQSGIVKGATPAERLQAAYDKAIRLDDEVWQKTQEEARQAEAAKQAEAEKQKVVKARATAVSPRSSSPTGMMNSGNGKKGIRELLEEQLNAASGRV